MVNVIEYASVSVYIFDWMKQGGSFLSPPYNNPFKSSAHKDGH